jgi:hypothetical protein
MAKVGRPKTDSTPVLVRLSPEAIMSLDKAIDAEPDDATRPEMVRRILERWFIKMPHA